MEERAYKRLIYEGVNIHNVYKWLSTSPQYSVTTISFDELYENAPRFLEIVNSKKSNAKHYFLLLMRKDISSFAFPYIYYMFKHNIYTNIVSAKMFDRILYHGLHKHILKVLNKLTSSEKKMALIQAVIDFGDDDGNLDSIYKALPVVNYNGFKLRQYLDPKYLVMKDFIGVVPDDPDNFQYQVVNMVGVIMRELDCRLPTKNIVEKLFTFNKEAFVDTYTNKVYHDKLSTYLMIYLIGGKDHNFINKVINGNIFGEMNLMNLNIKNKEYREIIKNYLSKTLKYAKYLKNLDELIKHPKWSLNLSMDEMEIMLYESDGVVGDLEFIRMSVKEGFGVSTTKDWLYQWETLKSEYKGKQFALPQIELNHDSYAIEHRPFDPRMMFVGNFVGCCQVIDDHASDCQVDSLENPYTATLFIEKDKEIVGECWIWMSHDGDTIILDSIEVNGNRRDDENIINAFKEIISFYQSFGYKVGIGKNDSGITRSFTEDNYSVVTHDGSHYVIRNYHGYRNDSVEINIIL